MKVKTRTNLTYVKAYSVVINLPYIYVRRDGRIITH